MPEALSVPVLQISLHRELDHAAHIRLGRSLMSFRNENVQFLCSGGAVHNLGNIDMDGTLLHY
jgi:aromatic ring-opening dioxygenase catalytic subunit (LigB family)